MGLSPISSSDSHRTYEGGVDGSYQAGKSRVTIKSRVWLLSGELRVAIKCSCMQVFDLSCLERQQFNNHSLILFPLSVRLGPHDSLHITRPKGEMKS